MSALPGQSPTVAVLIPCHNESLTIRKVVADFRSALPNAHIYVYDNGSTDDTAAAAREAGAIVRSEHQLGKGNVVRRMLADVEADIYVMVDGDGTYDPAAAPGLVATMQESRADMVIGTRQGIESDAKRSGHATGNRLFNALFRWLFGRQFTDIFSGYRVLSRRFAKTFPAVSSGFEIETELSVHAAHLAIPVEEVPTAYSERAAGSSSKLSTVGDGGRILRTFFVLLKETRPFLFFGSAGTVFVLAALGFALPLLPEYFETGEVARFPTAILATGLVIVGSLSFLSGVILDSLARSRVEQKRLAFLSYAAPLHSDIDPA